MIYKSKSDDLHVGIPTSRLVVPFRDDLWSCWQFVTISMLGFQHRDSQVLQVSPGHITHGSRSQVQHQQASCTSQVDSVQHKLRAAVPVATLEFYNVSWNMNIAYLKID